MVVLPNAQSLSLHEIGSAQYPVTPIHNPQIQYLRSRMVMRCSFCLHRLFFLVARQ